MEAELQDLLAPLVEADLGLPQEVNLSVIISDRMEEHVDRVSAEYGIVVHAPYKRGKTAGHAGGITLSRPERPPLEVTVVFDVQPWLADDGDSVPLRLYLVGHEIGHVLQEGRRTQAQNGGGARTHAEAIHQFARSLLDEVDADRQANRIAKLALRDREGQPLDLAPILGPSFVGAIYELLRRLAEFTRDDVQEYLATGGDHEALGARGAALVRDLLVALVHTLALYSEVDSIKALRDALDEAPGFRDYLAADWEAFVATLVDEQLPEAAEELVRIVTELTARVGLRFEDRADGSVFIHVSEPLS